MNLAQVAWAVAVLGGAIASCTQGPAGLASQAGGAAGAAGGQAASAPSAAKSDELFLDGFFPIGVFAQPVESFAKWKSRGINTLLEVPQNHNPEAWDSAAVQAGFRIIRRPLANAKADIGRKDLLAWSHWDEPDAAGRIFEWTPLFERTFAEWRRIDPNRKVFINFAGPDITWFTSRSDDYSRRYASHYPRLIATADWVANDLYPSGGYLNNDHARRRGDVTLVGEPVKVLRRLTSKPQFAFVEASEIEKGNVSGARCPTPGEMRAQIWHLIALGVRGLFYFPAVVGTGGFRFDGAPETVVKEMTAQNRLISSLAPLLQSEVNPARIEASAPAPVSVGWRAGENEALVILVNTSGQALRATEVRVRGVAESGVGRDLASGEAVRMNGGSVRVDFEGHGVRLLALPLK